MADFVAELAEEKAYWRRASGLIYRSFERAVAGTTLTIPNATLRNLTLTPMRGQAAEVAVRRA
jgi:hypothetical protein